MTLQGPKQRPGDLVRTEPPRLTLHHIGFDALSLQQLRDQLDELARELRAVLSLQSGGGDVVLLDEHVPCNVPARLLHAFCEGRPCITVARDPPQAGRVRGVIAAQKLRQALLHQIDAMHGSRCARVNLTGPTTGIDTSGAGVDSGFDARAQWTDPHLADKPLDPGRRQLLHKIRQAWQRAEATQLCASFGPGRSILFDFTQGLVWAEVEALHCLRVQRDLPHPAPTGRLISGSVVRDLDVTLWDLAAAAGPFALLDAPLDWWHVAVTPLRLESLTHFSNLPLHLELARALADGGMTPARLRRECRTSVNEVRGFLQASLYLGLVHWASGR